MEQTTEITQPKSLDSRDKRIVELLNDFDRELTLWRTREVSSEWADGFRAATIACLNGAYTRLKEIQHAK